MSNDLIVVLVLLFPLLLAGLAFCLFFVWLVFWFFIGKPWVMLIHALTGEKNKHLQSILDNMP